MRYSREIMARWKFQQGTGIWKEIREMKTISISTGTENFKKTNENSRTKYVQWLIWKVHWTELKTGKGRAKVS